MKKLKLLALAFVIGTSSLFAINVDFLDNPEKEMRSELVKMLDSPDLFVDDDITVMLKFTFNSEGEIVLLCPGCKNKKIVDYMRSHLNNRKFENPGIKDKIYTLPLTIKAG